MAQASETLSLRGHTGAGAASAVPSWPFNWFSSSLPPHHLLQDGFCFPLASHSHVLSVPCPLASRFGPPLAVTPAKPGSTLSTRDPCRAPTPFKAAAQDQRAEGRATATATAGENRLAAHMDTRQAGQGLCRDSQAPTTGRRGLACPWEHRDRCWVGQPGAPPPLGGGEHAGKGGERSEMAGG